MVGVERTPKPGDRWVICQVCGIRYHKRDTVRVRDRYNTQNNMIVCKKDVDKINPQVYPFKLPKEKWIDDPSYVSPEPIPELTAPYPDSDTLPSAPKNLVAQINPLQDLIELVWDGPEEPGTSPILGYIVTRATPQAALQVTIEANTGTSAAYYLDTTSDINEEYTYQVAAISELGTGPYSNYAYWPVQTVPNDINYLLVSQDNSNLTTGDGTYIIL